MKRLLLILLCVPLIGVGQVYIPDANFKAYLVGNTAINTNGDTEIQQSEAVAFNGTINCPNLSINDLTGIEDFTALTYLHCWTNQLTSLDVSNNTALLSLYCAENYITCLDISHNIALTELGCNNNLLEQLNTKNGNWQNMFDVSLNQNNLTCVEVDNIGQATNNWTFDSFTTITTNCNYANPCATISGIEEHTTNKELIKITDILGREIDEKRNTTLFYIYNDGTVEKKIIIE